MLDLNIPVGQDGEAVRASTAQGSAMHNRSCSDSLAGAASQRGTSYLTAPEYKVLPGSTGCSTVQRVYTSDEQMDQIELRRERGMLGETSVLNSPVSTA